MKLITLIMVLLAMMTFSSAQNEPQNKQVLQAPGGPIKPQAFFGSFWSQFIHFNNTFTTKNPQDLPLNILGGIFSMVDGILNAIINPVNSADYGSYTYEPQLNFLTYTFCQLFAGLFTPGSDGLTPCANITTNV